MYECAAGCDGNAVYHECTFQLPAETMPCRVPTRINGLRRADHEARTSRHRNECRTGVGSKSLCRRNAFAQKDANHLAFRKSFDALAGIDLGDIWDSLDPDFQATIEAVAREVVRQAALLELIRKEGYGKAWLAADAPFVLGGEHLGGAWTFGVNWSGTSKAFGIAQAIEFDEDAARGALEDWFNQLPINRPVQFPLTEQILLAIDPLADAVRFAIDNDSSILSKAAQMTELNVGYSRHAWSSSAGSLYLGAEARLYLMRLSRLSVRFGDITDSEELFDAIRHSDFRNAERLGVDIGALWVGKNYQIDAQLTNVNEPKFIFPDLDLSPYSDEGIIGFLQRDQSYTMDRQFKLEASLFTSDRRWSTHLGLDADPATDPTG